VSRWGRLHDAIHEVLEGHYYDYGTKFHPGPMSNCDPDTLRKTVEEIIDVVRMIQVDEL
jgi:hypothetical protein